MSVVGCRNISRHTDTPTTAVLVTTAPYLSHPMNNYRHLWPEAATKGYLNGASRAPQLKSVAVAAREAIAWREQNAGMPIPHFFDGPQSVKAEFARLIGCPEVDRVALVPAASYGLATVAKNLPISKGDNIIVVAEQFPSNYYVWKELCTSVGAQLKVVAKPTAGSADSWSDRVLASINNRTAAVAIGQVHWADGSLYDLAKLRTRTNEVDAWLVVDGTQSVGAYPINVSKIAVDALVCGGYKWLQGPYGCGYAYFGERMDNGKPLEENWINRAGSENFTQLVNYQDGYRPLAGRYSVGEHSNFLMMPMQLAALQQVNAIGPATVQKHDAALWEEVASDLAAIGVVLPEQRAHHLVGLRLLRHMDVTTLADHLTAKGISVSYRGDAVRISPNVYNTPDDMEMLLRELQALDRTTA